MDNKEFDRPKVDEDYLMDLISGDTSTDKAKDQAMKPDQVKPKLRQKPSNNSAIKLDYEQTFLVNRFPSGRNGKVVYIRAEYHERLLRLVQLTREDKTTLYAYIDNILEQHFKEFSEDITTYFNDRYKPIL